MINLLIWLIVGGVIGWLASIIMRTDGQQGIFLNIIVGIVGAFIAMRENTASPANRAMAMVIQMTPVMGSLAAPAAGGLSFSLKSGVSNSITPCSRPSVGGGGGGVGVGVACCARTAPVAAKVIRPMAAVRPKRRARCLMANPL